MKPPKIHIAKSHAGMLHERLGVADGEMIPLSTLLKHKNSPDMSLRKMVNFALNARQWGK